MSYFDNPIDCTLELAERLKHAKKLAHTDIIELKRYWDLRVNYVVSLWLGFNKPKIEILEALDLDFIQYGCSTSGPNIKPTWWPNESSSNHL